MAFRKFLKGSLNPKNLAQTIHYKFKFNKDHPNYFYPEGLLCFCGRQGSGKTLSAVSYIKKVCMSYPKCVLVSNIEIKGIDNQIVHYSTLQELINMFDLVHNGEYGVIYFVDEIQVLFNSLLRRGMNVSVLETISQQRKQRKHIVGTAQIYMKIDKVFREQMNDVVLCNKFLGAIQINRQIDGSKTTESDGKLNYDVEHNFIWFHYPKLYESYDTSKIISAYKQEYENTEFDFTLFEKALKNIKEGGGAYA